MKSLGHAHSRSEHGTQIPRPALFWTGVAGTTGGVLYHVPMFIQAAPMHYQMAGMPMSGTMWLAMAAIVGGFVLAACGLIPRDTTTPPQGRFRYVMQAPEGARLGPAHRRLIGALAFALLVDQMKPATLAFIEPGMRREYHLSLGGVALLPMVALAGTVLGSLTWGYLADLIGRRPAILLATLLFAATTVCGAMPSFGGNLLMCGLMGMSAGGLLPIVYTLMAEAIPANRRSVVMVLQAGLTTVLGYLAAAGLAAVFIPMLSWRVLWFLQLPLVMVMLAINRWFPESPGFLLTRGRFAEARQIARRFGAELIASPIADAKPFEPAGDRVSGPRSAARLLFGRAYRTQTLIIMAYALSWGTIYWGFITFLPSLLQDVSGIGSSGSRVLFFASLLSIPGTAVGAYLYHTWSSRNTMALYGGVTVVALLGLAVIPLGGGRFVIVGLIMMLLTGSSGVVAVLGPYTAEVYPTTFRGLGSGLSAACSKAGGMFGPPLIAFLLTVLPDLRYVTPLVALPMAAAAVAIAVRGRETTRRRAAPRSLSHQEFDALETDEVLQPAVDS